MVVYAFNLSTQEAEAKVQGQPGLQSEFKNSSYCYTKKSCRGKINTE